MSVAPTATQTRESRTGLLWTAVALAYALVILFPSSGWRPMVRQADRT